MVDLIDNHPKTVFLFSKTIMGPFCESFCRIDFAHGYNHGEYTDGVADGNGDISEFEFFDPKWIHSADKITFLPTRGRGGQKKKGSKEPSLVWALARSFGGVFMMGGLFKFLQDILNFVGPQLLKYVLKYHKKMYRVSWVLKLNS